MNPVAEALMSEEEKKYRNARKDVLQAAKSISELTEQQQEQLVKELFGATAVVTMYRIMQQHIG